MQVVYWNSLLRAVVWYDYEAQSLSPNEWCVTFFMDGMIIGGVKEKDEIIGHHYHSTREECEGLAVDWVTDKGVPDMNAKIMKAHDESRNIS